jgi:choline monooxygenase
MGSRLPLSAKRFAVARDIRRARTLPPEAFIAPEVLARELETVFRNAWLLAPPRPADALREDPRDLPDLLLRRGSRVPVSVLDRPLFLQRDWEGGLRAFPNVCTHAWHPLVRGPDRQRSLTCPQHGRQFDCRGRFLSQPGFARSLPGFPAASDHLAGLPVAEWGPLLFVALGKPQPPFERLFAPVRDSLARFPLGELRRHPMAGEQREIDGNWKQHAWNYMDRLHIPYLHRSPGGLTDAIELSSYRTELHPRAALQWAYARDPMHGFDPALLPDRFRHSGKRVFALWWLVFPNLALNLYPWGLSVNAYMPVPDRPERTLFLWYHYVLDKAKHARREELWLNRQVDDEDVDAMRQVLQGIRSGLAPRGRFSPAEEAGPHWFHRLAYASTFGKAAGRA